MENERKRERGEKRVVNSEPLSIELCYLLPPPLQRDNYWLVLQGAGNEGGRENRPPAADKGPSNLHQHSEAFSEFESRYGLHADPLYSRHQREKFLLGLSPGDVHNVFVEPHILATPTLADTNGDGNFNELVVPVSYYFDPFYYGDPHNLGKLGGLDSGELVHFVAGGVVVIDLSIGAVVGQKVLGLTEATDSQPAYMLSSPTVVRMFPDVGGAVIITATATGEVNMLEAESLESVSGFPVRLDSVSASVAVADLFKDGVLELVVGDNSGNIYCIDSRGKRRWEFEAQESVQSDIRFTDFDGDSELDVVFVTTYGSLWVLRGVSGTPFPGYPVRLNTHTQSAPLLIHLVHTDSEKKPALTAILPGMTDLYLVDLTSRCVDTVQLDGVILNVLSGDVDPYSPGIEILTVGLDGKVSCYSASLTKMTPRELFLQSWNVDLIGHSRFTHRQDSVSVLLPWEHDTSVDLHGNSFNLEVVVLDNAPRRSKQITLSVSIGRKYLLYNGTLPLYHQTTTHNLLVSTPPEPMASFITVTFCTEYLQCQTVSRHIRFNLGFRTSLQWYLCGPFFALAASFLWLLRDADFEPLPVAVYGSSNRKSL